MVVVHSDERNIENHWLIEHFKSAFGGGRQGRNFIRDYKKVFFLTKSACFKPTFHAVHNLFGLETDE